VQRAAIAASLRRDVAAFAASAASAACASCPRPSAIIAAFGAPGVPSVAPLDNATGARRRLDAADSADVGMVVAVAAPADVGGAAAAQQSAAAAAVASALGDAAALSAAIAPSLALLAQAVGAPAGGVTAAARFVALSPKPAPSSVSGGLLALLTLLLLLLAPVSILGVALSRRWRQRRGRALLAAAPISPLLIVPNHGFAAPRGKQGNTGATSYASTRTQMTPMGARKSNKFL